MYGFWNSYYFWGSGYSLIKLMEKKFFWLVTNAYDNVGGLLYAPKGVYRLAVDGEPVKKWENIIMKLKDGLYTDFSSCVGGANLVSIEFKEVVEKFIPNDYPLEFLPVKAESENMVIAHIT